MEDHAIVDSRWDKLAFAVVFVCSIVACVYHLGTGVFGLLTAFKQRSIHLALIGTVALLAKNKGRKRLVFDWLGSIGFMAVMVYFVSNYEQIMVRGGNYTTLDVVMCGLLTLCILYIGLR